MGSSVGGALGNVVGQQDAGQIVGSVEEGRFWSGRGVEISHRAIIGSV